MADTITFQVQDAYSVMNTLVKQATGQSDIVATDTSTFVDAGKKVLEAGYENLYNALGVLIGRTIVASRAYEGKFKIITEDSATFENRIRKISYYSRLNQASGMYNTNLNTNLGAGLSDTDGVGSQWEQNPAIPVERYFFSDFAWDKSHTQYLEQAKIAFTNEGDFIRFINGIMVEVQNDIESTLEAKNRMVVLDRLAGTYLQATDNDMPLGPECAVNLTTEFNKVHGTSYTTAEILSEHSIAFLEFFIARFKIDSDKLENRTMLYHDPMTKTIAKEDYVVLRHTPKSMQRFIYYSPMFTQLNLNLSEIFNPQMLKLPNGEGVQYWQSFTDPSAIDVTPALPDGAKSSEVKLSLVVGLLFDEEAMKVTNKFNGMYATPINARHVYTNMFWHYKYGVIQDYSENAILYYMDDTDVPPVIKSETFTGDGTEDDFVLTGSVGEIVKVTVDDVEMTATTDYTYDSSTQTVTFTTAPADESVIVVSYTEPTE